MDSTENSFTMLQRRRQESCDFCDRTFKTRFDSIIHNASHIIIPLIKQECHKCDVCLHYFASREELHSHHEAKHATSTINHNTTLNTKIKLEISNEFTDHDRNDYSSKIETARRENSYNDAISNLKEDISSSFRDYNSIDIIKPEKHRNEIEIKHELMNEDLENDDGILLTENECHEKPNSIKSRLRFEGEDDLVDDVILSNLVTDSKINMFNEPINKMPGFKNLNSRAVSGDNRTLLNGSSFHQTTPSNSHMQLKLNNNYSILEIQAVSNKDVSSLRTFRIYDLSKHENNRKNTEATQPLLEKFNNPLTLIDDLEYDNFVVRNIQKVEQHDETDLLVNHIKKIDKSNTEELWEPVINTLSEPVSNTLLEPVSSTLLEPVLNTLLEPVSSTLLEPVSNTLLEPVSNTLSEPEYNSVHYSELIKPGTFKCKYCSKSFPNWLLLVQHEPAHMRARRPRPLLCTYCDVYVAGHHYGLRRHLAREHPGASPSKKHETHRCDKCGLKFRKYARHVLNYHRHECHGCGKEYSENESSKLQEHLQSCAVQNVSSKLLNVCDMCYTFIKMNQKYILTGTTEYVPGVRYPCSRCGKKFFELKTIKRMLCSTSAMPRCHQKKARKPMSNEERLKKVQHRLKQIKLLNKY